MSGELWECVGEAGGYAVWRREAGGGVIYNMTKDGMPPSPASGGYPVLESLLQLKGLNISILEPREDIAPRP